MSLKDLVVYFRVEEQNNLKGRVECAEKIISTAREVESKPNPHCSNNKFFFNDNLS